MGLIHYTPEDDTGIVFEKEEDTVLISCYFKLSFFQKIKCMFYFFKHNRTPPFHYPLEVINENIPVIMEQLNKVEHKPNINKPFYKWKVVKQFR